MGRSDISLFKDQATHSVRVHECATRARLAGRRAAESRLASRDSYTHEHTSTRAQSKYTPYLHPHPLATLAQRTTLNVLYPLLKFPIFIS